MRVEDVMTRSVITVAPGASYKDLVELLLERDVSALPVVSDDGDLVGIVTEADLVAREAYGSRRRRPLALLGNYLRGVNPVWLRKSPAFTARDVMSAPVLTAEPSDELARAARLMLERPVKRLPVMDGDRLVGIVSRHDLLKVFDRSDDEISAEIDRLLANPRYMPDDHRVTFCVGSGAVTLAGTVLHPSDIRVIEDVVGRVPGVVEVQNLVTARAPEPHVSNV